MPPARTYGPESARCEVLVFREGLLSSVGHDLVLRAEALEVAIDPEGPSVTAKIDASGLRVVTALCDGRPLPGALSPSDVRDIERAVAREVLRAERFPVIRFVSTRVEPAGDGYEVQGSLAVAGALRPFTLPVRRDGGRLTAEATLHQPDLGIRPYRAMLGALRVKPDVLIRVSVPAE